MAYDIIGDIHGQADKLESLLSKLGYVNAGGAWRHSGRQAIFVGDFVDRGPEQIRCIDTVRRMVDAGNAQAVMGNHELNAIAWHTPDPRYPGEYLRPHFDKKWGDVNRKQHAAFLAEVKDKPGLHAEVIGWFLTLPLWLDLPELRVVHACWHGPYIRWLTPHLRAGRFLTRELMPAATIESESDAEKDGPAPSIFKAVEAVTKGIELPLSAGHEFLDKDGHPRNRVRVRWWDESAVTYRSAAMLPPAKRNELPDSPIPEYARLPIGPKPVFFGHYWLTGDPALESDLAACVDYSAGNGGPLVAYRFNGDRDHLSPECFTWVD